MATAGAITVTIHGLDQLRGKLNSSRSDIPVRRFLDRGAIGIQGEGRRRAPVDTGRLRNSISVESPTNRMRRIGPNVEYGPYVEFGTRPHYPPKGALSGWAQRHGMTDQQARQSIGRKGTKAQPYMAPAAEGSVPLIRSLVPVLAAEIESAFQGA